MQGVKRVKLEPTVLKLSEKSKMEVYPHAVKCTPEEFQETWKESPTTQEEIKMFGNVVKCPRFQRLYGEGVSYTFSGITLPGHPEFPPLIQRCLEHAKRTYPDLPYRAALVNWYPDGDSYIGAHSDDERDLLPNAPILSYSFGQQRTFRIRDKKTKKTVKDVATEHESMIAMCGDMQKEYTHEVTKTKKPMKPRINVTVRAFR